MSTRGNSFDIVRERQELDAFLSTLTNQEGTMSGLVREKQDLDNFLTDMVANKTVSDLARERRELDDFLATIVEDKTSPALDETAIRTESHGEEAEAVTRDEEDAGSATEPMREPVTTIQPTPMAESLGLPAAVSPQYAGPDTMNERLLTGDGGVAEPTDAAASGSSDTSGKQAATGDEIEEGGHVEMAVDRREEGEASAVASAVMAEPVPLEPASPAIGGQGALPEDPSEEEIHPEALSERLSTDMTVHVLDGSELELIEIHHEESDRLETASDDQPSVTVPLVMERDEPSPDDSFPGSENVRMPVLRKGEETGASEEEQDQPEDLLEAVPDHPSSDRVSLVMERQIAPSDMLRPMEEEPAPQPAKAESVIDSDLQNTMDRQDIPKDEPAKDALPLFIIRKGMRGEHRPIPPETDQTVELRRSAAVAEESDAAPILPDAGDKTGDEGKTREEQVFGKAIKKTSAGQRRRSWIRAGVLFVIFAGALQAYLWLYPEAGQQAIRWMALNIPYVDQLVEVHQNHGPTVSQQVTFTELKQRFVYNIPLGKNIRIVEGFAVNQAAFPLSTIKVLGELYNASGSVLASKVTYCGNILTEEKLTTLGEEEIRSAMSIPQGGDLSNSRIMPQNRVPFMIIFTNEPIGVVKTTIMPISAAKVVP